MKDGPIRRFVKRLARLRYRIDLAATRAILARRGEPRYDLRGSCRCCGSCCETPMIAMPGWWFHLPTLRRVFVAWHKHVNGFELLDIDIREHTFVFRCTHWEPQTRLCDSYESRPQMCRDYPRPLLYDPRPEFLPDCGYYPLAKDAESIRRDLAELDLPPEKLAEVEIQFYVRPPARPGIRGLGDSDGSDRDDGPPHDGPGSRPPRAT